MVDSNFDRYRGFHASAPRESYGGGGKYVTITTGIDRQPPETYTDSTGTTYRRVDYGTLGGGTMYVENPRWDPG